MPLFDWETIIRDVQERPLAYPLFRAYSWFMEIKRYDKFPFYVYPGSVSISNLEDRLLNYIDFLVDAHELERRKLSYYQSFYQRSNYVCRNFLYYANDTMANCYFDGRLRDSEYERLDSTMQVGQVKFFGASVLTHITILAYMSYFFRYKRLTKLQTLGVGTLYYQAFSSINNSLYKIFVDKPIIGTTRSMGLEHHIQPNGTFKPRGINF